MVLSGLCMEKQSNLYQQAKDICIEMGHLFQAHTPHLSVHTPNHYSLLTTHYFI